MQSLSQGLCVGALVALPGEVRVSLTAPPSSASLSPEGWLCPVALLGLSLLDWVDGRLSSWESCLPRCQSPYARGLSMAGQEDPGPADPGPPYQSRGEGGSHRRSGAGPAQASFPS